MTLKLRITTFIMNNKLQEKLLLLRAKKYINRIRGIKNIAVNLDDYTQFQWHRDIYNKILRRSELPEYKIALPASQQDIYLYLQPKINIDKSSCYYMFFEGKVIISFYFADFYDFFLSHMLLNNTFDMNILSLNPDRVIDISEDEYDLNIYDIFRS